MIKKFYNVYKRMGIAAKAALWFVFCNLMQKGISTITVPIFTRLLTTAEYGTYSLYISWFNILTIITSLNLYYGVYNNALNRFQDGKARDEYISSMQGVTATLTFALFLVFIPFRGFWSRTLGLSELALWLMFAELLTLFFFLLGYTFKYNRSLKNYIKSRFKRTMIPYYIWAIISIAIFLVMVWFISVDSTEASLSLRKNLIGMLYGNSRTIYMKWNQPLWFIPCMNLTLLLVWLIEFIKIKYTKCGNVTFRATTCLISTVVGVLMRMLVDIKFPFQFESAVLMVAFVELGMIFREDKFVEQICKFRYGVFVDCVLFLIGIITVNINGVAGVRTYNYGKYPLLFCVSAGALTVCMALISCRIQHNHILEKMGQISFPILLMHKFPILFFQLVLPITRDLLAKPDTAVGLLSSFVVVCITIGLCYVGTIIIRRIAPVIVGG